MSLVVVSVTQYLRGSAMLGRIWVTRCSGQTEHARADVSIVETVVAV